VVQSPDRVNKFFTSVTTLFAGKKRYEVVKAVWPFATHKSGVEGRRCAVQSEAVWWEEWRDPIRHGTSVSVCFCFQSIFLSHLHICLISKVTTY